LVRFHGFSFFKPATEAFHRPDVSVHGNQAEFLPAKIGFILEVENVAAQVVTIYPGNIADAAQKRSKRTDAHFGVGDGLLAVSPGAGSQGMAIELEWQRNGGKASTASGMMERETRLELATTCLEGKNAPFLAFSFEAIRSASLSSMLSGSEASSCSAVFSCWIVMAFLLHIILRIPFPVYAP
jgi:hypothetical protein